MAQYSALSLLLGEAHSKVFAGEIAGAYLAARNALAIARARRNPTEIAAALASLAVVRFRQGQYLSSLSNVP